MLPVTTTKMDVFLGLLLEVEVVAFVRFQKQVLQLKGLIELYHGNKVSYASDQYYKSYIIITSDVTGNNT